jgi:hypothetical protein
MARASRDAARDAMPYAAAFATPTPQEVGRESDDVLNSALKRDSHTAHRRAAPPEPALAVHAKPSPASDSGKNDWQEF